MMIQLEGLITDERMHVIGNMVTKMNKSKAGRYFSLDYDVPYHKTSSYLSLFIYNYWLKIIK